MSNNYSNCKLCPRQCGVNRSITTGVCNSSDKIKAAKACLHYWEEPPISGKNGSGAVFFSGCSLKCCFCQNFKLSHENFGREISAGRLGDIFLELQEQGAENINLVNPTHYVYSIIKALDMVKYKLNVPVIYNSGGYERVETLRLLNGYIDIYLPDLKYFSGELSKKYSKAPDYFEYASKAILEMHNQQPQLIWTNELLKKGLIIRHLVLPGCRHDSIEIVKWLSEKLPADSFMLSLMSQYTPAYQCGQYPEINRRVTTFEYNSVLEEVRKHNISGYTQDKKSASLEYTPEFNLNGI